VILIAGLAHANPISLEVLRAKQLPSLTHVQLTYGVDGKTPATPTSITRDGVTVSASWTGGASYSANTGSGLKSVNATQLCDCNVPLGAHTYKIKVTSAMGTGEVELQTSVTVTSSPVPPKDAGAGDLSPWEIPEPTQMQGLNCTTACATPAADKAVARDYSGAKKDAAVTKLDTGTTKVDTGTTKPKDDGGCAVAGRGSASALALLLGLGLLLTLRRR